MVGEHIKQVNHGDGKTSYARNSALQRTVISNTLPVLDETLEDMFVDPHLSSQKCYKLVDFGCASGPNSLCAMTHIIDTILNMRREKNVEFEVYLNDLPDNDFNSLFKSLSDLHGYQTGMKGRCFVYGLPDSFYRRLLAEKTLHFAYSSYALQWLSQVPGDIGSENKENIFLTEVTSPKVVEAYSKQFRRDFSTFLMHRAEEMVQGGRMVLSLLGRNPESPYDDCTSLNLLGQTLLDMVIEGLVKREDLYTFNVPIYPPRKAEVHDTVEDEGSFTLDKMHDFCIPWAEYGGVIDGPEDPLITNKRGKILAHCVRAFMEPMIVRHFGSSIIDGLFERYAKKVGDHMAVNKSTCFTIVVSLTRK